MAMASKPPQTSATARKRASTRPYRSLGLSLAIIGAFSFLGVLSGLPALLVILLRLEGRVFEPRNGAFWAVPLSAALLMVVCFFAWAGRPRRIRIIFIVLTVLTAALNIYTTFRPDLLNFVSDGAGGFVVGSSFESVFSGYLRCMLAPRILVTLFVVWYCRRPVVRAFYGEA
jgi:hypothetical protein